MKARGVGLILATSKTAAEVAPIREATGFADWPAIVENGAGLLEPGDTGADAGGRYNEIRALLREMPKGFQGFGDMSAEEVAAATGLSLDAAEQARDRAFTEPGLWTGDPEGLKRFEQEIANAGLLMRRGGRFLTLSFGATKADQMALLTARYAPRVTLALGDAPNDIEMLEAADFGVIIANDHSVPLPPLPGETAGRIIRTALPGPEGWADAVSAFLNTHAPDKDESTHG